MKTEAEKIKPVYYFYGSEEFLVDEAASRVRAKALSGGLDAFNLNVYDAKTMKAEEPLSVAETYPVMAPMRVVIIRNAESMKKDHDEPFAKYVLNPIDTTCMIFASHAAKLDKTGFIKALEAKGYVKAFSRLRRSEMSARIKTRAKEDGKKISDEAAEKLALIGGEKLRDVLGELEKLMLFVGEKAEITVKDVEDACIDLREETLYSLSDAIGTKNLKDAMTIFEKVSGEPPAKILSSISRQLRTLLLIKSLAKKGANAQRLPGLVRLPPFVIDNYVKRSRLFTEGELIRALDLMYDADTELKTGKLPQALVVPKLIVGLCR